jgi:hypothetical protein
MHRWDLSVCQKRYKNSVKLKAIKVSGKTLFNYTTEAFKKASLNMSTFLVAEYEEVPQ